MLKHGKHSGAPYQQVAAEDRKYCAWVLREERESNQLSHNMKAFATYLKQQHGGLMTVGKHAGKFFNELMKEDPEYAIWVQSSAQPSAAMKEFAEYIAELKRLNAYTDMVAARYELVPRALIDERVTALFL